MRHEDDMITINYANLPGVLLALVLAGYLYNALVVENNAMHMLARWRQTSVEVVIGVTFTLVGAGILMGGQVMLLMFLLFAASGIPMIIGDFKRVERLIR
jgi:hypothetical protein